MVSFSLKAATLFSLLGVTSAGDSAKTNINYITDSSNKINVDFFTSMTETGALSLNFKATIDKFFTTPVGTNPRFCLGLRETGQTDWDIAQMSMIADTEWSAKDGMDSDVVSFCVKPFDTGAEAENDWIVTQQTLNYDANANTLSATFVRNLIGNNDQDYTFKIGGKYDYKMVFGNWGSATDDSTENVFTSPDADSIEILSASYNSSMAWRVAATTAAIAAMGATYL